MINVFLIIAYVFDRLDPNWIHGQKCLINQ